MASLLPHGDWQVHHSALPLELKRPEPHASTQQSCSPAPPGVPEFLPAVSFPSITPLGQGPWGTGILHLTKAIGLLIQFAGGSGKGTAAEPLTFRPQPPRSLLPLTCLMALTPGLQVLGCPQKRAEDPSISKSWCLAH